MRAVLTAGLFICFAVSFIGPDQAWSVGLSPDLKQMILDRLADVEEDRDILLEEAMAAIEAGVPEETVTHVVENSLEGGVDGRDIGNYLREITAAYDNGLPTGPLAATVLEGLEKRIDNEGISTALDMVRDRMETVVEIIAEVNIGPMSDEELDDLIIRSSAAHAAGLDRQQLTDIYRIMADGLDNSDEIRPVDVIELVTMVIGYGIDFETVRKLAREIVLDKDAGIEELNLFIHNFVQERRAGGSVADLRDVIEDHFGEIPSGDDRQGDIGTGTGSDAAGGYTDAPESGADTAADAAGDAADGAGRGMGR